MLSHPFCSKQDRWFSVQLTNRAFVVEIVDSTFNGCSEVVAFPVAEVFSPHSPTFSLSANTFSILTEALHSVT